MLKLGKYILKNIPKEHPMAILNDGKKNKINYKKSEIITILVSGGGFNYPYYEFNTGEEVIDIDNYIFMDNVTYTFKNDNVNPSHPMEILVNSNIISLINEVSITLSSDITQFAYQLDSY